MRSAHFSLSIATTPFLDVINTTALKASIKSSTDDISGGRLNNLESFSLPGIVWSKLLTRFFF